MKKILIASGIAFLALATVAAAATFSTNLTVGSRGADVTALQTALIAGGYSIPAGATGYFGSQTKAAVVAYQTAKSIPSTGFVGPLTRASLNGATAVVPPVTNPVTGTATGITTPGVEGTLSVSQGAVSNSTLYVGDMKAPVLSLALQAQTSDIAVQRVQIDLGNDSTIYTKKFSNIYVIGDNGQVLASMPLNINTVSKLNNEYYVTLTGFSYIISKNSPNRYLTIAVDVMPSVDTTTYGANATVKLAAIQPVRGIDGAGISQYAGDSSISQLVTLNQSLSDSADVKISTDVANSGSTAVIANSGPNNDQADKVTSLIFDVKAEKDNIGITQVVATTTIGGAANNSSTTNAYLYDGSTLVASAAIGTTGVATFSNINGSTGYVVPANTTKAFTIKVDIRSAGVTPANLVTTITSAGVSAQNSQGSNLLSSAISGGAVTPNSLAVQKAGAVFALVGTPTITKDNPYNGSSTITSSFTFTIAAQGTSVTVGSSSAFTVGFWYGNSEVSATSTGSVYSKPTSGVTNDINGDFVIADGSTAQFTVTTTLKSDGSARAVTAHMDSAKVNGTTLNYISSTFQTPNTQTL